MKEKNKGFVLDTSITICWCFSSEATAFSDRLLQQLELEPAYVPSLWFLEVGNVLVNAERRKRISFAQITEFLTLLGKLNIQSDEELARKGFHEVLALAHSEGLTTYDASYLELALRKSLPLASKDVQLCSVASKLGVQVLT
jgi:predicted nucleic acid-binding protein